MSLRQKAKRVLPTPALNFVLLAVPGLYSLPFVQYETNIWEHGGLADICRLLEETSHCPGDVIECGASRCGTSIIMASHIRRLHSSKIVYALDSFRGFPPDEVAHERSSGLSNISAFDHTSTSLDYVTKKIRKLGYTRYVVPVPGFFSRTLPRIASQSTFSFAFVDCDLKESTAFCCRNVWPRLDSGGILAIDDYIGLRHPGVKVAVDDFVSSNRSEINDLGMMQRLYFVRKR